MILTAPRELQHARLTVDLMTAGIIPPGPVPPLLAENLKDINDPSYHGMTGAVIVTIVALLGGYLALRWRVPSNSTDSKGGAG